MEKQMNGQISLLDIFGLYEASEDVVKEKVVPVMPAVKAAKKHPKKPKQDKFLAKYEGYQVEDWGTEASKDFKAFARAFKGYITRILPAWKAEWFNSGHYDISMSLSRNGVYVYLSYSLTRNGEYCAPIDFTKSGCMEGVLVRSQKGAKDYTGGQNHFCSILDIAYEVENIAREVKGASSLLAA